MNLVRHDLKQSAKKISISKERYLSSDLFVRR
jgi:hypothetical protein